MWKYRVAQHDVSHPGSKCHLHGKHLELVGTCACRVPVQMVEMKDQYSGAWQPMRRGDPDNHWNANVSLSSFAITSYHTLRYMQGRLFASHARVCAGELKAATPQHAVNALSVPRVPLLGQVYSDRNLRMGLCGFKEDPGTHNHDS